MVNEPNVFAARAQDDIPDLMAKWDIIELCRRLRDSMAPILEKIAVNRTDFSLGHDTWVVPCLFLPSLAAFPSAVYISSLTINTTGSWSKKIKKWMSLDAVKVSTEYCKSEY